MGKRKAILHQAVSLATVEGLEGLSIGGLAKALGVSKSRAVRAFRLQAGTAAVGHHRGGGPCLSPRSDRSGAGSARRPSRLISVCDHFFDHLQRQTFPGGCFFAGAILEMGTRRVLKEQISTFELSFVGLILSFASKAQELEKLPAGEDITLLVFELNGIILAANANFVMSNDPAMLQDGSASRPAPARRRCRIRPRRRLAPIILPSRARWEKCRDASLACGHAGRRRIGSTNGPYQVAWSLLACRSADHHDGNFRAHRQLVGQDAADVGVHCPLGNEEPLADLAVSQPFSDELSHLELPWRQGEEAQFGRVSTGVGELGRHWRPEGVCDAVAATDRISGVVVAGEALGAKLCLTFRRHQRHPLPLVGEQLATGALAQALDYAQDQGRAFPVATSRLDAH